MKAKRKINPLIPVLAGIAILYLHALPWSPTTDLITQSPWTHTETWDDWDGDGTFARKNMACEDDNNWNFTLDSAFVMLEDSIVCEPDLPLDTITAQWYLIKNETVVRLSFSEGAETIDLQIHSLGQNKIELNILSEDQVVREKLILFR